MPDLREKLQLLGALQQLDAKEKEMQFTQQMNPYQLDEAQFAQSLQPLREEQLRTQLQSTQSGMERNDAMLPYEMAGSQARTDAMNAENAHVLKTLSVHPDVRQHLESRGVDMSSFTQLDPATKQQIMQRIMQGGAEEDPEVQMAAQQDASVRAFLDLAMKGAR